MQVSLTTLAGDVYLLDVSPDIEIENLKALAEAESGVSMLEMILMHNAVPLLDNKKSLKQYGVRQGDVILIQHFFPQRDRLAAGTSSSELTTRLEDDPMYIREMLLKNPDQIGVLRHNNPALADAINNPVEFARILTAQQKERKSRERQRIRMMNADPFDPEAQRLIAEEIRQQNIDSNMEAAMEYHPESFGQVVMLYINCRVNGHPVKAFIDSGAQTTIMSQKCAERCAIERLIDTRWAGIAKGVGTQRIIGRIHLVQIEIGGVYLTSNFSVLEEQPMDMMLGLDMLKRHQCIIDLKRNVLVIGTTDTETPFLPEGELPPCARLPFGNNSRAASTSSLQHIEQQQLEKAIAKSKEEGKKRQSSVEKRRPQTASPSPTRFKKKQDAKKNNA